MAKRMSDTIVTRFLQTAAEHAGDVAVWSKRSGRFESRTWREFEADVRSVAVGLARFVEPGDRIALLSENRYEWLVCDLAMQLAQAVHVPLHAPLTAAQVAQQIEHSGARTAVVSTAVQAEKLAAAAASVGQLDRVYSFDPCDVTAGRLPIAPFEQLYDSSSSAAARVVENACTSLSADSVVTILYTSGTTGEPKGVVLNHGNLVSNAVSAIAALGSDAMHLRLCLLPLSHIYARTCDLYTWVVAGSQLALAESRETVLADCAAVRPTVLNGVPFFYDRVMRAVVQAGRADDPHALGQLLGGRIRMLCGGGAALPDHVFDFFHERGLPILQGYGLTETSPVITASTPARYRRGSCGPPIPGVEIRIADDGEILTRGPHVMVGYYNDAEATAATIRDGWLYTGDLGQFDADGFLFITGRKKEILVTSGGKNVAPVQVEALLTADPLILQAVVVGEGRDYLAALIVPQPEALQHEIVTRRIPVTSSEQALTEPRVVAIFADRIASRLQGLSPHEQVRMFALLDRGFTIESGELTPKLSLRRSVIEANCAARIAAMYDD